jgi:hypothetical protein
MEMSPTERRVSRGLAASWILNILSIGGKIRARKL